MSKPVTNQNVTVPSSKAAPSREATLPNTMERVALIIDHGADRLDESMLYELPRFLPPGHTQLSLLYLWPDVPVGLPFRHNHMQEMLQTLEAQHEQRERAQQECRQHLEQAGFSIVDERTYARGGKTLEEISHYLEQSHQELAVVCAGSDVSARAGRPSYFTNIMAHLPIAATLLRRRMVPSRLALHVLLAVDDSEASMTAVRIFPTLIQADSLHITLVTVQTPIYQDNAMLAPFVNQDVLDDAMESNATMIFEMARDILESQHVQVSQVKRLIGSPAAELSYLAQVEDPDLLVVGSHNRKGFLAWLMGSVSSQLLHWDAHNIFIVR